MKKILIIRFSSIGDIVLTTPVIRCLANQLEAEIHFLTKKPYSPLVEANPHLSKVFTIEKDVSEVMSQLKAERYDILIDLHKNLRSLKVKTALRSKSYTFDKLNPEKWLLVNFRIDRMPDVHIVDRYMAAVQPLAVINDGKGLDYFLPDDIQLPAIQPREQEYLTFAIGAAHKTKKLPLEMIVEICKSVDLPVILLGGREEAPDGDKIAEAAGGHITNACGRLSLHESASIIRSAKKVITHDTGMMHIAAAFDKEIISIWGNTVPALGMTPYYGKRNNRSLIFEVKGLSCRPCSKIGYDRCPRGHFKCMYDQTLPDIIQAANGYEC